MSGQESAELEACFHELLRTHYARLRRMARSYSAPGEHEDLLQEMLAQVWRSLPGFDGRAKLSSWVYRVALNTALGFLRKRYTRPVLQSMAHADLLRIAPASVGDPADPDALLDAFLARLAPVDRAVLMLLLDGQSHADIADITGLSSNAVGIRINRIKKRFIEDYVEDYPCTSTS